MGLDGPIILKQILKKYDVRAWTEFVFHRIGSSDVLKPLVP